MITLSLAAKNTVYVNQSLRPAGCYGACPLRRLKSSGIANLLPYAFAIALSGTRLAAASPAPTRSFVELGVPIPW